MERDASAETLLRDGRQAYASRRYKQAAKCFTLALKRCPCTKGIKRERCRCKNFTRAAESNTSLFQEALSNCCCDVGKTFGQCDNELHIRALDYRAAAFEALDAFDRARNDAELILELAPRCLTGYLRLGKVYRLERKNAFALRVFNAGVEAAFSAGISTADPDMKKLMGAIKPLKAKYTARDPLELPVELVNHIFLYLDFVDRMVCTRVSKQWRAALTGPAFCRLWRTLEYPLRHTSHNVKAIWGLKEYAKWSRCDLRTVAIGENAPLPRRMVVDFDSLLSTNRKLECIKVHDITDLCLRIKQTNGGHSEGPTFSNPRAARPPHHGTMLRFLSELGPAIDDPLSESLSSIPRAKSSMLPCQDMLTHLELGGVRDMNFSSFPNLRYLSVSGSVMNRGLGYFDFTASNFPLLEQLKISFSTILWGPMSDDIELWPHLKVLVLHIEAPMSPTLENAYSYQHLRLLHRLCMSSVGNGITYLDINFGRVDFWQLALDRKLSTLEHLQLLQHTSPPDVSERCTTFTNLRALRLGTVVSTSASLRPILEPSVQNETLHEFDINFEPLTLAASGHDHLDFLKAFDWLKGAQSIRTLGVRDFFFNVYSDEQTRALPEFLQSFPELRTLHIESKHYNAADLSLLIFKVVKSCVGLKTIFAPGLTGMPLDNVRKAVRGSSVVLRPEPEPKIFPVPIDKH